MTDPSREGVSKPPLDFSKIERLRIHCKLTKGEFASLCGVSRMAYHGWTTGRPIRPRNDAFVRQVVRKLLVLASENSWPEVGIEHLASNQRLERIQQLVSQ